MKTIAYILSLLTFVLIFSCKRVAAPGEVYPDSTFDSPFPKDNKQLARIFGNTLLIKNYGDTLILKISSTKTDNLIVNGESGDTIFFGKVCKYRGLYYFNRKVDDTSYYISAFKIKGNLIYGLDTWMQYYGVDGVVKAGGFKKLVKSINSDTSSIRLRVNKLELRKMFTSIINDEIPDTILSSKSDLDEMAQKELALEKGDNDGTDNYLKVYPNPASDFINVSLNRKSSFQLTDFNGEMVLQGKLTEPENRIDVSSQKSGIHFLTISDLEKTEKKTVKIFIK